MRRDRRAENNGDVIVFGTKSPREDDVPWVENAILCHMQLEMEGGLTIKITETWPANPGHGGQAGCLPRHTVEGSSCWSRVKDKAPSSPIGWTGGLRASRLEESHHGGRDGSLGTLPTGQALAAIQALG